MELNTNVKAVIAVAMILVLIGVTYFSLWLPFWNFLNNEEKNLINREVPAFSGDILGGRTPSPNTTPGKSVDKTPKSTPAFPEFEEGTLNILLLGEDASHVMTDTICVVNVDAANKKIKMVSIPRDSYVPYSNSVRKNIKELGLINSRGIYKLNASKYIGEHINYQGGIFDNAGINFLCSLIEIMVGYTIDEYALVDFDGFIQIVDIFGGVNVTSRENIYNNKGELIVQEGLNRLDGKTALFYARARYRYDEYGNQLPSPGDSYRKENQLNMLAEVSKELLTAERILQASDILNTLRNYIYHSITVTDVVKYTDIALDFADGKYTIETLVIKGEYYNPPEDINSDYVKIY